MKKVRVVIDNSLLPKRHARRNTKYFTLNRHMFIILCMLLSLLSYGQTFTCGDTLIDSRDGKKYATVLIGTDCWFKQNLNYGQFVQSDSLGITHSQQTNNGIPEKYAQQNDTNNLQVYGGLYEQAELMNYSSVAQGLCPIGWHVSSDQEWQNIISVSGGILNDSSGTGGNALKAIGEGVGAGSGTDLVGISLKHGGDRVSFGFFYGMGLRAIYWTSTSAGPGFAYHYTLWASNDTIERLNLGIITTGFSCRCVKDQTTGINENSIENSLKVYPNPSNSIITISNIDFSGEVLIYNSKGQLVDKFGIAKQTKNLRINLTSWPKGLYLLTIIDSDEMIVETKKIILE